MQWFNEDPATVLKLTLEVSRENKVTDIIGIGPSLAWKLQHEYDIIDIGDLIDYVKEYGFMGIEFREESKFAISYRVAHEFMQNQDT
jgi:hypothetical protein